MPIKDKNKTLIHLNSNSYENLLDFLSDIFYKNKDLAKPANEFMRLVYDLGDQGISAKNWKSHISIVFNLEEPKEEELEKVNKILEKYGKNIDRGRGSKQNLKILKNHKITDEEKTLLERAVKWNSSISSYYSIVNKLKAVGLIDKKSGKYYYSNRIFEGFDKIKKLVSDFKENIRT